MKFSSHTIVKWAGYRGEYLDFRETERKTKSVKEATA
jgi:hypothetical protein